MNCSAAFIAVDVGNTAVKLSIQSRRDLVGSTITPVAWSIRLDQPQWLEGLMQWVNQQSQMDQLSLDHSQWRIASVQRRASEKLKQRIVETYPTAELRPIHRNDIPMRVKVDFPEIVGIDRLLGAFAAYRKFGRAVVIVDAGSAVTVDLVDSQGAFCGGAIIPGLHLQTNALATGTDALPPIDWNTRLPLTIPAKNTSEAIRLGVLMSVTAAIDRLIDCYSNGSVSKQAVAVVLCGGDSQIISQWIEHQHSVVVDLVLEGVRQLSLA